MRNLKMKSLLMPVFLMLLAACAAIDGQETAGAYLDDATITTKVKAAFVADSQVKSFQISVETMKGVVQLSGFVDSSVSEAHAVQVAGQVNGVKSVKDSLVVVPKASN